MPDVKLQPLLDAIRPKEMAEALEPFLGTPEKRPRIVTSRLQAPTCYWAVYKSGEQRVTFKSFFSGDEYQAYLEKLRHYYDDRFGQPQHPLGGIMLLPELNGVLWSFPFDPHMPELPHCQDPAWIAQLLGRRSERPLRVKLIDYNPEIAAIMAYRDSNRALAYGKATPQGSGEHVYDIMDRLWWSTERLEGQLRVAKPIAYIPEAGFLLQSAVRGRTVQPYRNSKLFLELVKTAGSALALIHNSDIPFGPERRLKREVDRLRPGLNELELTSPPLFSTMRLLIHQLEARMKEDLQVQLVPSHGDYKWNQFLECNGRFSLIDFEFFCQAERWFDLGYFCGYLPPTSPEDWRDGAATEVLRNTLLQTYAEASGLELDLERIGLYEAATLGIRAMTLVWQHQGSWQLRASQLLDMAIDRLVSPEPKRVDVTISTPVAPAAVAV